MAEPHKRARRHPKYKKDYQVRSWPVYDRALRERGDVTLWISEAAIAAWRSPPSGWRGGQQQYSDLAIQTALISRLNIHLPLRQTEGFLCSIFRLADLDLPVPDHTTLSRGRPQPGAPSAGGALSRGRPQPGAPSADATRLSRSMIRFDAFPLGPLPSSWTARG